MSVFGSTMKTLTIPDDDPVRIYRSAGLYGGGLLVLTV